LTREVQIRDKLASLNQLVIIEKKAQIGEIWQVYGKSSQASNLHIQARSKVRKTTIYYVTIVLLGWSLLVIHPPIIISFVKGKGFQSREIPAVTTHIMRKMIH